jgi:hypothetical protein
MNPTAEEPPTPVPAVLPVDVVRAPSGQPAVLVVRTGRGWTVLGADTDRGWVTGDGDGEAREGDQALTLVEAMSLADLVAAEHGITPEPDRETRRAARGPAAAAAADTPEEDPRGQEIAALRRTVGQLEHALAARVSIERAIGVLAERHGCTPRQAFEELRGHARSQGRPAQELATEVLDGLPGRTAVPDQHSAPVGPAVLPAPDPRPATDRSPSRRVQRNPRRADGDGTVPEARN